MTTRVAVDVVVLTLDDGDPRRLRVVVTGTDGDANERLPGDLLRDDESLESAASRVMASVGLDRPRHLEQLATFGQPHRTGPPRTVSVSYLALVPEPFSPTAPARWVRAAEPPGLVGDHDEIVAAAVRRVRSKLSYSTIAYGLLPDEFTMSELQEVYEAVLATTLDKRNFRKKVQALGLLVETGGHRRGSHRPAALHRFADADLVLLDDTIISG